MPPTIQPNTHVVFAKCKCSTAKAMVQNWREKNGPGPYRVTEVKIFNKRKFVYLDGGPDVGFAPEWFLIKK